MTETSGKPYLFYGIQVLQTMSQFLCGTSDALFICFRNAEKELSFCSYSSSFEFILFESYKKSCTTQNTNRCALFPSFYLMRRKIITRQKFCNSVIYTFGQHLHQTSLSIYKLKIVSSMWAWSASLRQVECTSARSLHSYERLKLCVTQPRMKRNKC